MKIIENKPIVFKGIILTDVDSNKGNLTTLSLFKVVLENSSYDSAGSLMKAIKVESNLKDEDGKINLDDADFDFLKKWSLQYQPLLHKGLMFAEFFKQLE